MTKWINESAGTISAGQQLEPVLLNGRVQRGRRNGEFVHDPKGIDILHRVIPGQVEVPDDDPRVRTLAR